MRSNQSASDANDAGSIGSEPAKVVAERLGHSTTQLTNDTYAHVLPGMQEGATERLEEILYESH